jgi:hypothetical protein
VITWTAHRRPQRQRFPCLFTATTPWSTPERIGASQIGASHRYTQHADVKCECPSLVTLEWTSVHLLGTTAEGGQGRWVTCECNAMPLPRSWLNVFWPMMPLAVRTSGAKIPFSLELPMLTTCSLVRAGAATPARALYHRINPPFAGSAPPACHCFRGRFQWPRSPLRMPRRAHASPHPRQCAAFGIIAYATLAAAHRSPGTAKRHPRACV